MRRWYRCTSRENASEFPCLHASTSCWSSSSIGDVPVLASGNPRLDGVDKKCSLIAISFSVGTGHCAVVGFPDRRDLLLNVPVCTILSYKETFVCVLRGTACLPSFWQLY